MSLTSSEMNSGSTLPSIRRNVTQENIDLYAQASRDFNPIHINEEFAKKTPAGGTIAHGMLIMAYVSQAMTDSFGRAWLSSGKLNVRFKAPARPGDVVTISGKIVRIEKGPGQNSVFCELLCENQKGEAVITGDASLKVRDDNEK
jgi:3-hydroxybutyryl-CoA dehydratase